MELNFKVQLTAIIVQCIAPTQPDVFRPLVPTLTVKEILQSHEKRVIIQPPAILSNKLLVLRILADVAALISHCQEDVSVFVQLLIIDIVLKFSKIHGVAFLPGQDTLFDQGFQIDKIGVARKGGEGLIRRIAIGSRMDGQNLPIGLTGISQPVNESICFFGKTANAVLARQAGDGH